MLLIFVNAFLTHCDIESFLAIRLKHDTVDCGQKASEQF